MINRKFFGILVVVLVVLGAIQLMQNKSRTKQTSHSDQRTIVSETFVADELSRIVIGYGDETEAVDLFHNPDGWVVVNVFGHRAAEGKIDPLLAAISGLSGEFRSDNESVLGDYGLSDAEAVHITLYRSNQTDPICALLVGAQPTGARGNFVRRSGSNEVCLSGASLLNPLGLYSEPALPKTKHFMDLQALQLVGADVEAMVLTDGDQVTTVEKDFATVVAADDTTAAAPPIDRSAYDWKMTTPVAAAALKTKVDAVQNAIVRLHAIDIADPAIDRAVYGLNEPTRSVHLAMKNGTELIVLFGAERQEADGQQDGVYMQVAGDATIWIVTSYKVDSIFKVHTELLPED